MKFDVSVSNCNTAEYLLADKPAECIALRTLQGDFTYGSLQDASVEFSRMLIRSGLEKGDRVLLLSCNSFHWVAAYLGTLLAGMVCVPLPGSTAAKELLWIVSETEAKIAFVENRIRLRHQPFLTRAGVGVLYEAAPQARDYFSGMIGKDFQGRDYLQQVASPDLAALMYTSGSTGTPRGVMVSHGNIVANTESIIAALDLQKTDRIMVVLPFHYCFGASLLHTYLKVGATLVLDTRFAYPETVLQRMRETECTAFAGVPSHYQILLRNSSLARGKFPHLRALFQAGGHLAPTFLSELKDAVPGARIVVMYGQTEATARLSWLPSEMLATHPGSIGKAIPGVTLRVLDESGAEVSVGGVGEIVAEGPNIAQGYWRSVEETEKSFRNGRLYTGDLATVDGEGFLYIVDRFRNFVKCGGKRVSIRLIEDRLLECRELLEVAVVGVPDDILGEAIRAFVVPRFFDGDGFEDRLRSFCKKELESSLHPRDIIVVRQLPKSSSGKVLRAQLKSVSAEQDRNDSERTLVKVL